MAGDTIGFRPDADTGEQIEAYRDRRGLETKSDAVNELVETGLMERTSPVMYRLKDQIVGWAGDFAVFAVLILLIARVSTLVPWRTGVVLSVVLFSVAVALLAALELARAVVGANQVGQGIRDAIQWVRA